MGHRHTITAFIDGANVGSVLVISPPIKPWHVGLFASLDFSCHSGRILITKQAIQRNVHKSGIAHVLVFIHRCNFHGFGEGDDVFNTVVTHSLQVKVTQNVQHLEHHCATTGQLVRCYFVVTVATRQRGTIHSFVLMQVLLAE